jgi:hypothetical protein
MLLFGIGVCHPSGKQYSYTIGDKQLWCQKGHTKTYSYNNPHDDTDQLVPFPDNFVVTIHEIPALFMKNM